MPKSDHHHTCSGSIVGATIKKVEPTQKFTLTIVVPVFRGADTIGTLVRALSELRVAGGHEVVLVDDGSPDNSLEICHNLLQNCPLPLTLISLSRNFGEHNAVLAGLRCASGNWVITMDDDLQNPPTEVTRLLSF